MESQKAAVLQYFKADRTLIGARNLYNHFPNRNRALQNSMARMTDSEANRAIVHYELAKHVGISERQLTILLNKPVERPGAPQENASKVITMARQTLSPQDQLLMYSSKDLDYQQARSLASELGLKTPDKKKETLYRALEEARTKLVHSLAQELPDQTKASIKLRDQFPFLKDPQCPDALKILVNDLITTYEAFKEAQPRLHQLLSQEEGRGVSELVLENYIANKAAYAELEHYQKNGHVLGEHPVFERMAAKQEISNLSTTDLVGKIKNLGINIGKNRKKGNEDLVARDEELLAHAEAVLKSR